MKLAGKFAVVTGASQGLGYAIARRFVQEGASVLLCSRTAGDLDAAAERVRAAAAPGAQVLAERADVSSEADVGRLATIIETQFGKLDILVSNAGVLGPKGAIDEVAWSDWSLAISINLMGTVLCCRAFLPLLRQSARGKILLVSGGGATKPRPFLSAYAASKAAVVRFGENLSEELREAGIDVNSIAPGALNTRLLEEVLAAGPEKVGRSEYEAALRQKQSGGSPVERGAELCVYLASSDSDGITGKLISAVWDPWTDFAAHRQDLEKTDIYTLRRIVPGERGLPWG
ncbi:MAG TPA: SDR family oxidoreductase [Bryobacteraceae bacterium]|nr:SDR family oxidoreductase [Bryobacteraceae bacterium]